MLVLCVYFLIMLCVAFVLINILFKKNHRLDLYSELAFFYIQQWNALVKVAWEQAGVSSKGRLVVCEQADDNSTDQ